MAEKKKIKGTLVRNKEIAPYVEELKQSSGWIFESACLLQAYQVALSDEADGLEKQMRAAVFFVYPEERDGLTFRYYTALLLRMDSAGGYHYLNAGRAYWKDRKIWRGRLPLDTVVRMTLQAEITVEETVDGQKKAYSLSRSLRYDDMELALLRKAGITVKKKEKPAT